MHVIATDLDYASSVHATDLDGDGDMDILSTSPNNAEVNWYENDGNQNFTKHNIATSI